MANVLSRLMTAIGLGKSRRRRDPRQRPGFYDGSEAPEQTPPGRYARGKAAVPAPPPGGAAGA